MKDYGALLIATALFGFLCPGLVIQLPGKKSPVGFLNMKDKHTIYHLAYCHLWFASYSLPSHTQHTYLCLAIPY